MGLQAMPTPIPDNELIEAFKFFDSAGNGMITKEEFATMVRSLGQTPSKLELKVLLKDNALDDQISIQDVRMMMETINGYTAKRDKDKLMDAFRVFDPAPSTGKIKKSIFKDEILTKIGEKMDAKEVADTMKNLEESGAVVGEGDEEEIVYEKFVEWIMTQLNK